MYRILKEDGSGDAVYSDAVYTTAGDALDDIFGHVRSGEFFDRVRTARPGWFVEIVDGHDDAVLRIDQDDMDLIRR